MYEPVLTRAHHLAAAFLETLESSPVRAAATFHDLVTALGGPLDQDAVDATTVLEQLAAATTPGLMPSAGPRYFGFVTGGSLPAALAADWLVSAWDQNAALHVMSPAMAAIEAVTSQWLLDLLTLPTTASVGFVTGATMANVTALAAARHEVLRRAGWDVEADGLQGAPRISVIAGAEAHASVRQASRLVGLGSSTIVRVAADEQGRMRPDALQQVLDATEGPVIVCAQAGNVNTGACDPVHDIAALVRAHDGWLHVDGAFGLWAAVSSRHRHLVAGIDRADSWTVDCHKWLNVPYDSGLVVVAHPAAHRAAMSQTAAYLVRAEEERDGMDWTPEASRRARAVPIYAALRASGRGGIEQLIDRCCAGAARMAAQFSVEPGVHILNDVVLNQVLLRFHTPDGANVSRDVIASVQRDGVCWVGGTEWQGAAAMRISVSNWRTSEADIDLSAESIRQAFRSCCA